MNFTLRRESDLWRLAFFALKKSVEEKEICRIFEKFGGMRALVIGDSMIDSYHWGTSFRMSPEAKVPVITVTSREQRPGGAANVAINLHNLGAKPVLFTVTGADQKGNELKTLLHGSGLSSQGVLKEKQRITTVKNRILDNGRHVIRIDEEITVPVSSETGEKLFNSVRKEIGKKRTDVILFVDYDKGVISPGLFAQINELAVKYEIPVAVDPKNSNFGIYREIDLCKPNFSEFIQGTGINIEPENLTSLRRAAAEHRLRQNIKILLITMSESGAMISSEKSEMYCPAIPGKIADVTGAGDTSLSVAALSLAAGLPEETIIKLSNLAGSLVCESYGVCPVNKHQLIQKMKQLSEIQPVQLSPK